MIPYFLASAGYNIFFLAKYGQTVGKMILRIRVARLDGGQIALREAALRHSVDALFALVAGIGMFLAIQKIDPAAFTQERTWTAQNQLIIKNRPYIAHISSRLSNYWVWSEMVVLLFNKRRRAIHDFIAGTVVIHVAGKTTGPDASMFTPQPSC